MVKPDPSTDDAMRRVRERMRELREARGMSHREAGDRLGISGEGYRRKEVGTLGIDGPFLARLARVYDMPLTEAFPEYEPSEGERVLAQDLGCTS